MSFRRQAPWPGTSPLLVRLLDPGRRFDYFALGLFAAVPLLLAWGSSLSPALGFDVFTSRDILVKDALGQAETWTFRGFAGAWNFLTLIVILPGLLWATRWAMAHIAPVNEPWPPRHEPALLGLLDTAAGKRVVYGAMRQWLLSRRIVAAALIVTLLVHVVDMREVLIGHYIVGLAPESHHVDWTHLHFSGVVGKLPNLVFMLSAYAVQFAVVLLGFLAGFLLLAHNLFFLSRVYQRRWVPDGQEGNFFEIDLADEDRCFGFREANEAFNTQMLLLMAGGVAMLASRFFHASDWRDVLDDPAQLLPDAGQMMMVGGWYLALLVVFLPALVKLLPRLPLVGNRRASRRVSNYLMEFVSPQRWPFGRNPSNEETAALAARFASHAFWPTGNNRASQLLFFALWIGLVVLLAPPIDQPLWLIGSLIGTGVLAYAGKMLVFGLLHSSLRYVDDALVDVPAGPQPELRLPGRKLDAGIFISYRREDSAAYTGRLYDHLVDHFHRERLFIDIDAIAAGDKFGEVLQQELAECAAVIVMIGPQWTTLAGADGRPRLMAPDDWVSTEVAAALARGVPVFPVLVGGAAMPSRSDLPAALAGLCDHNGCEISNTRWDHDARRLMKALRAALDARRRADA